MEQVHWQLELLPREPISLRGRVFFWWKHELCFSSGTASTLEVFCCDSFLDEWSGSVVQKSLNSLSRSMQYFIFPGTFYEYICTQQLSAACLWPHLSLSQSDDVLGLSYLYQICFKKAKLLMAMARSLQTMVENSPVTLTRTLAIGYSCIKPMMKSCWPALIHVSEAAL